MGKRILVVEPEKAPEVREIEGKLEELQGIVGGLIEAVEIAPGIALWCNEEGKCMNLQLNRFVPELVDVIAGTFFISRDAEEGKMGSLTDEDVARYTARFAVVEGRWASTT